MLICPNCKYLNPAEAEACAVCGKRLADGSRLPSAPTTVVNKSRPAGDTEPPPSLSVRTPPPSSLPAPMVEPIDPAPVDTPTGPPAASGLTRGLSQIVPDSMEDVSEASAAAVTLREPDPEPDAVRPAPPTLVGSGGTSVPISEAAHPIDPRLVVVRGERLNVAYPILNGRNYVGRSADRPVDIDLDGQEPVERIWTSRQHAVLTWDRGVLVIEDLNSLNGTFVNRTRIHPGHRQMLRPGDVVQIGTVQLRVVI
jgi:hypothetical protein